jgi:phosphate transport system permease protein
MSEGTAGPTGMTREDVTFGRLVQLATSRREGTSRAKVNLARRHLAQRAAFGLLWLSGIAAVAILLAVVGYVVVQGAKVVNVEFLTTPPAGGLAASDVGGMSTTVVSTVYLVFWTIVIAGPLGVLAAIYLVEYAEEMEGSTGLIPAIVNVVRFAVEILAGVPSIIFGLFGYALFVSAVSLGWSFSLRSAAVTGACLVLPVIIRASEEAIKAVPRSYREASLALGATKWQTAWKVVLPAAAPGIITGIVLSVGRVVSETAVFFVTFGGTVRAPDTVFDLSSPGRSMALHVYYLAMETRAFDKAMGTGAVLILTIILINLAINIVSRRLAAKLKGR